MIYIHANISLQPLDSESGIPSMAASKDTSRRMVRSSSKLISWLSLIQLAHADMYSSRPLESADRINFARDRRNLSVSFAALETGRLPPNDLPFNVIVIVISSILSVYEVLLVVVSS